MDCHVLPSYLSQRRVHLPYTHICMCVYVCMYVCMYVCVCWCVCVRSIYPYTQLCCHIKPAYLSLSTQIKTHSAHTQHTHETHAHKHAHIHTHTRTKHTQTHTNTHIPARNLRREDTPPTDEISTKCPTNSFFFLATLPRSPRRGAHPGFCVFFLFISLFLLYAFFLHLSIHERV